MLPDFDLIGNFPIWSEYIIWGKGIILVYSSSTDGSGAKVTFVASAVVECIPYLYWCKYPNMVGISMSKYLLTSSAVKPGNVAKLPFCIAFIHILLIR